MSDENNAPVPPSDVPAEPPNPAPGGTPSGDETISIPKRSFNERLDRHFRKQLKDHGLESPEELQARLSKLDEYEKAEEQRAREQMTREEQMATDLAAARAEAEAAREAHEEAQFDALLAKTCAAKGIRDVEYAAFEVVRAAGELGEGEDLDLGAFLDGLLEKPNKRAALGFESAPEPPEQRPNPVTTTPGEPGKHPPPAAPGAAPPPTSVHALSDDEWRKRREALNLR